MVGEFWKIEWARDAKEDDAVPKWDEKNMSGANMLVMMSVPAFS